MPKAPKESKHAVKLRERGFTPIDKETSLKIRALVTNRKQRRQLSHARYRPWFTMSEDASFATDDTGQSWRGPANHNLKDLGFDDKTALVHQNIQMFFRSSPSQSTH